jgi:AraC family transcriptional regulator of adaptative response/methylated-DNA-[protein]-cysteine methyltransferase
MYRALVKKDPSFVGLFYAAVTTTGIFCHPTCTARKPKRENVEFYQSTLDAIRHGYRPCKICSPLELPGETPRPIRSLLDEIERSDTSRWKDADLRERGIEPSMVRRWFKKNHGMTFQAYLRMRRINIALKKIQNGDSVTGTAFDSGYASVSGFQDSFKSIVGVSPKQGKNANVIDVTRIETPLGPMIAGAMREGICLLEFSDRRMLETQFSILRRRLNATIIQGPNPHFTALRKQLGEYFEGKRTGFDLPIETPGTPFEQRVWKELQRIPYGSTRSYKRQATALGSPAAVRAVANANGRNRIAIIIPCHRVIGEDGHLTGYGGGLWRKQWLLDLERKHGGPKS